MITIAREGLEDKYSLQLNPGKGAWAAWGQLMSSPLGCDPGERARLPKVRGVCGGVCVLVLVERDLAPCLGKGRGLDSVGARVRSIS